MAWLQSISGKICSLVNRAAYVMSGSSSFRSLASHEARTMSSLSSVGSCQFSRLLQPSVQLVQPCRGRINYSLAGGKPKTVQEVIDRFFRLDNGLWIRTRAGRNKRRWVKPPRRQARLQQHVFVNKTQCRLLDRMVNIEYKQPKFFVADPYAPYHRKSNLTDRRYEPPIFLP